MSEYITDRSRAFYLTTDTKDRFKAWKKRVESRLGKFLPFERFLSLLLEHEEAITQIVFEDHTGSE